jgi:hypothetical protein
MDGFAIDSEGLLLLFDECGSYCYAPEGLFHVVWLSPREISGA